MITKLNFTDHTIKSYAIRKLTPKECFRLMGVRDNVIGTMQSSNAQAAERLPDWNGKGKPEDMAISASQQYKQAGNSICIDVLAYLYQNLFYPAPPKPRPGAQLSLFDDLEDSLPAMPAAADKNEKRYSSPHSPATTRSSWQRTCYASGIPISDGRARDGATSTNTPVRCTTWSSRSLPTAPWATSPR